MEDNQNTSKQGTGLRFNEGKTRHDLMPAWALEQVAKVFTKGATKYAARNWENGMDWSKVIASLKRHLSAFEQGEDFDKETGLPHMAHVATNALFLQEYYKIFPQGDDRPHQYLKRPKIGLDIDEVLCDWVTGFKSKFELGEGDAEHWNFTYEFEQLYMGMNYSDRVDFYMSLAPKINPNDIPFEPHCYITARTIPTDITQIWLEQNGFPTRPVYTIKKGESKVDAAKKAGVDWFVDDRYEYFVEMNNAGICCFLMDSPHNRKYDVGFKRIYSLKDLAR